MVEYYRKHTTREPLTRLTTSQSDDVWAHTNNSHDLASLIAEFDLDANIVDDVRDQRELTRVESNDSGVYVFLRTLGKEHDGHVVSVPMLAVITPHAFVTAAPHVPFTPSHINDNWLTTTTDRSGLLLSVILDTVTAYEARVLSTGDTVAKIRTRLKTHEVNNDDFIMFVSIEDNLNQYHQNLDGLLSVMRRLHENRLNLFSTQDLETIDDVILHIEQLLVAIKSYVHGVGSIQNAYSTIANNRLNHRMKTLTVFTVLLTLPNVFYGMYGMNIALPFQDAPWAYTAIVGITVLLILVISIVAKRLRLF